MERGGGSWTRGVWRILVAFVLLAQLVGPGPARARGAEDKPFPETGFAVAAPFGGYWRERGGLAAYGYPLTPLLREVSRADGREYAVQYFERARFEHHPEHAGSDAEVLLGLLGVEAARHRRFAPATAGATAADRRHFAATGHTLGGVFGAYWEARGGLARFGLPLSEEIIEASASDGRRYTVQYFERARFEHHPEYAGSEAEVLLGHLGRQALAEARRARAGFVGVQGDQFVFGADRHAAKLKGINYWPRDHPWLIWREWDRPQVRFELDRAAELGVNSLRVFIAFDDFGGSERDWSEQRPLDEFLALCRERDIRVILSLFDSHRKWPAPGWDAWPAAGSAEEARDFAYLRAIVGPRRDDPTILGYDLYNEADWVNHEEWAWREHAPNRLDWLARIAAYTRALAPDHLLTVGTIFPQSLGRFEGRALPDFVDFVCIHYYRRNFRGQRVGQLLEELAPLDKPILIEEAGNEGNGLPGQTEADQVDYLREVIADARQHDIGGFLVWLLNDVPPRFGYGVEGTYGLLRTDYTLKPFAPVFRDEYEGERFGSGK